MLLGVVTLLSLTNDQMITWRPAGSERLYSGRMELFDVDLVTLASDLLDGRDLTTSSHIPQPLRDGGALPLLMAMRCGALWLLAEEHASDH